jgi:hypothetical protein
MAGPKLGVIALLIKTANLNDVEPFAYLHDIRERIVSARTKANEPSSLLPWAWKGRTNSGCRQYLIPCAALATLTFRRKVP